MSEIIAQNILSLMDYAVLFQNNFIQSLPCAAFTRQGGQALTARGASLDIRF